MEESATAPSTRPPWEEACQRFLETFPEGPLGQEWVFLHEACGRVLAAPVLAQIDLPPEPQALVEGYLVRQADVAGASSEHPVALQKVGEVVPGRDLPLPLEPGTCLGVYTGSPVPEGPYGVIPLREVKEEGDRIWISRPTSPGEGVEAPGSEIHAGSLLLPEGTWLTPEAISLLARQGFTRVCVARRPVVGILSTGEEVLPLGHPLRPGAVWDANGVALGAQVAAAGGVAVHLGIVPDEETQFDGVLQRALIDCDLVVISGGTFARGRPFVAERIRAAGKPGIIVDGVPMRSGRPILLALVGTKPIVCVAGYPPEALRGFRLFGLPTLHRLLGLRHTPGTQEGQETSQRA